MSLVNSGFDGTVTERDFSRIMRGAGARDSVADSAAWAVTQGTGRQVSVAPGVAYAAGVVSDSGLPILASLPTPTNGQFHLVVRRINWASNTVTVTTIPHITTTTVIPSGPPGGFPAFNDDTGVLVDHLLAWAWVRSTDTAVAVFDLRRLQPVGALPATPGMFALRPSSVVGPGVSLATNGLVTLTAATAGVALHGVFNQGFSRYLVKAQIVVAAASPVNMRVSRTFVQNNAANYFAQTVTAAAAVTTASRVSSATSISLGGVNTTNTVHNIEMEVTNVTAFTAYVSVTSRLNQIEIATGNTTHSTVVGGEALGSQIDGFIWFANSGNLSGSIRVYGFAD